jgi:hypothetical protein
MKLTNIKSKLEKITNELPIITGFTTGTSGFLIARNYFSNKLDNFEGLNVWDEPLLTDPNYISTSIGLFTFILGVGLMDMYLAQRNAKSLSKTKEVL